MLIWWGKVDSIFIFADGENSGAAASLAAGNSPLDCCIEMGSNPPSARIKLQQQMLSELYWWGKVDSNHRSDKQQIYSLSPLATREFPHMKFACLCGAGRRTRTPDLLITNQLLYRLSYTGESRGTIVLYHGFSKSQARNSDSAKFFVPSRRPRGEGGGKGTAAFTAPGPALR